MAWKRGETSAVELLIVALENKAADVRAAAALGALGDARAGAESAPFNSEVNRLQIARIYEIHHTMKSEGH
jgi:hypothetical protein